jgi:hypothetical protein
MQDQQRGFSATCLDFPLGLACALRASYAPGVIWAAPRRGLVWTGRDQVTEKLLREAASMHGLRFTRLRQNACETRVIDEFVARFTYAGEGIDNLNLPAGAQVELQRLRILTLADEQVQLETAIETWTSLDRSTACAAPDQAGRSANTFQDKGPSVAARQPSENPQAGCGTGDTASGF